MTEPFIPLHLVKAEYQDFIGVYPNFLNEDICEKLISEFKDKLEISASTSKVWRSDNQFQDKGKLGRSYTCLLVESFNKELAQHVSEYLQVCVMHYVDKYDALKKETLFSPHYKLQRTQPGGGYHVWHYEAGNVDTSNRILVWTIYLNDMPDGEGETEYIYQLRRIKPTKGTVVIWPAHFTHTHRGLTVLTEDKYILTGWFMRAPKL